MPTAERRQHILDSAAQVFSDRGYWAATMDDVSRHAGMSKKTVYQLFSSKAELFDQMLRQSVEAFTTPFETAGRCQRQILTDGLFRLADAVLDGTRVEITRVMIAGAAQPGDVADAIERQGICRGNWALGAWLGSQSHLGAHPFEDAEEMAGIIFWAAVGEPLMTLLLGIRPRPSPCELRARIARVVALFLDRPDPAPLPSA